MQSRSHVDPNQRWRTAAICILLLAVTFTVFGRTSHYDFVNLDDDLIVTDNPNITRGFSFAGIGWAFTHFDSYFYTPLTSISHMLDCSMYGSGPADAGGHHFTSVLIHAISAILLFLVLLEMTEAWWRSAFVAVVFAIHPLHVESVAWISERKDVLSGLFFMLTLWAYVHYTRRTQSRARYLMVALSFTLGLLSKPVVVTLPFLLLLLDYWPLGRLQSTAPGKGNPCSAARLIVEKIPLLLLSAAACVLAVAAQGEAIQPLRKFSLPVRVENAVVSCAVYVVQMFHPVGLAVFYPHPGNALPGWEVFLSLLMLVSVTAAVWIFREKHRYLVTGWFWYLGMLIPVAGIVQVGIFARADRFTYLSQIGLYVMGTWALAGWLAKWRRGRMAAGITMGVLTAEFMVIASGQVSYWKNSEVLWRHALTSTAANPEAENNLGAALFDEGRVKDSIPFFQKAVDLNPAYGEAHNNLGGALLDTGDTDGAVLHFQKALEINPRRADAHNSLGDAYYQEGEDKKAVAEYEKALDITPGFVLAVNNLAWVLATSPEDSLRNGPRALQLALEAYGVARDRNATVIRTLAAAYAEAGHFSEAEDTARRALLVADTKGNTNLAASLQSEIGLYHAHVPFHRAGRAKAIGQPPGTP